jgi:hypothetical protein
MQFRSKIWIFIVFLGILFAPMVQKNTHLFRIKGLRGQADPAPYPGFTLKGWFSGEFQEKFNKATEENLGFRPLLVRMKNQAEYTLFRKANASGVVVGRQNYLFEADYIRSYTGRDYLGDDFWKEKFRRLALVSDTLRKSGTRIAIVLEPGKATFYPDKIPARFRPGTTSENNYNAILRHSKEAGIPLLDLNRFFAENRETAPYPLFPKGGIHWSTGGMVLAADTLLSFVRQTFGFEVPDLVIDRVEMSDSLRDTDDDLAEIMNLMFKPKHLKMGYPVWRYVYRDTTAKPRVLSISDSFYFNFLNARIPANAFDNEAFWYYNQTIYPDTWSSPKDTSGINIRETAEGMDLILIMVTERFYHRFDWDFTDVLYRQYFPNAPKEYRYDFTRDIVRNYIWFDDIQKQSDYEAVPMRDKLIGNADYLFWEADQAGRIPHNADYYRASIMKDSTWMKQIREKAVINKISVEEQLRLDAEWMMKNQNQ